MIGTDPFMDRMEKYIPALDAGVPVHLEADARRRHPEGDRGVLQRVRLQGQDVGRADQEPAAAARATRTAPPTSPTAAAFGLNRGTVRYQVLVPSYTVTFAFFLVLTVGWLFVAERRHGTLVRLRAAPLAAVADPARQAAPVPGRVAVPGLLPARSRGKLVFGMNWGPQPWLLVPVVVCTSLAAVGLAMLVAGAGEDRDAGGGLRHAAGAGAGRGERVADAAGPDARGDAAGRAWSRRTPGRWTPTRSCSPTPSRRLAIVGDGVRGAGRVRGRVPAARVVAAAIWT